MLNRRCAGAAKLVARLYSIAFKKLRDDLGHLKRSCRVSPSEEATGFRTVSVLQKSLRYSKTLQERSQSMGLRHQKAARRIRPIKIPEDLAASDDGMREC
jgi:hypothetical protein